jgi:hypothetical protein
VHNFSNSDFKCWLYSNFEVDYHSNPLVTKSTGWRFSDLKMKNADFGHQAGRHSQLTFENEQGGHAQFFKRRI